MRVILAPDSFKGSLTSVEVARALEAGWRAARPDDEVFPSPLGDGGEGTVHAVAWSGGWEWQRTAVTGPDFRLVEAAWLRSTDGRRAYVEMAQASGISLVDPALGDATSRTSEGTGEVLGRVMDAGIRDITLGIGGSATTDGGRGILRALGAEVDGPLDLARLDARLAQVDLRIACDVTNPLLGATGAAATYAPQKGATPEQVVYLDGRLAEWADALEASTGRRERETPGAGAAGGVGFAFLAIQDRFRSFGLRPGVELVMDACGFREKLASADLVITGEGRIDGQTAFGKTAMGVARRAHEAGVRCIAVGGGVDPEGIEALRPLGAVVVPIVERPQPLEAAMAAGSEPVYRCGERIARLISLGGG